MSSTSVPTIEVTGVDGEQHTPMRARCDSLTNDTSPATFTEAQTTSPTTVTGSPDHPPRRSSKPKGAAAIGLRREPESPSRSPTVRNTVMVQDTTPGDISNNSTSANGNSVNGTSDNTISANGTSAHNTTGAADTHLDIEDCVMDAVNTTASSSSSVDADKDTIMTNAVAAQDNITFASSEESDISFMIAEALEAAVIGSDMADADEACDEGDTTVMDDATKEYLDNREKEKAERKASIETVDTLPSTATSSAPVSQPSTAQTSVNPSRRVSLADSDNTSSETFRAIVETMVSRVDVTDEILEKEVVSDNISTAPPAEFCRKCRSQMSDDDRSSHSVTSTEGINAAHLPAYVNAGFPTHGPVVPGHLDYKEPWELVKELRAEETGKKVYPPGYWDHIVAVPDPVIVPRPRPANFGNEDVAALMALPRPLHGHAKRVAEINADRAKARVEGREFVEPTNGYVGETFEEAKARHAHWEKFGL